MIAVAIGIRWTIAVAVHPRATTIAAVVATIAEDHPPPHRRAPCTEEVDATTRTATAVVDEEVEDAVLRRRRTAADAVVPVPHPRGTVAVVDAVAVRQPRRRGVRTMMITIAAVDTHVVPVVAVPVLLRDGEPVPSRIETFTVEIVIVGIAGRMQMNGKWMMPTQ